MGARLKEILRAGSPVERPTDALGYAAAMIRAGEYDVLLSGGTDGCVLPGMIFGFSRMRAVSTKYNDRPAAASRPFDSCGASRRREGYYAFLIFSSILKTPFVEPTKRRL